MGRASDAGRRTTRARTAPQRTPPHPSTGDVPYDTRGFVEKTSAAIIVLLVILIILCALAARLLSGSQSSSVKPPPVDADLDVLAGLRKEGLEDLPVIVGGIIPDEDAEALESAGVKRVYTPKDFDLTRIMSEVTDVVEETLS